MHHPGRLGGGDGEPLSEWQGATNRAWSRIERGTWMGRRQPSSATPYWRTQALVEEPFSEFLRANEQRGAGVIITGVASERTKYPRIMGGGFVRSLAGLAGHGPRPSTLCSFARTARRHPRGEGPTFVRSHARRAEHGPGRRADLCSFARRPRARGRPLHQP